MAGFNPTFTDEELQNEIWKSVSMCINQPLDQSQICAMTIRCCLSAP